MIRPKHLAVLLASVCCLAIGSGCGGAPGVDSSRVEAKVSGVVKLQGKPVSGGEVIFSSANVGRLVGDGKATLGVDGKYELTTMAGVNAVKFSGAFIDKNRTLAFKKRTVTLKAGENPNIDFDLGTETDDAKGPIYPSGKKGGRPSGGKPNR